MPGTRLRHRALRRGAKLSSPQKLNKKLGPYPIKNRPPSLVAEELLTGFAVDFDTKRGPRRRVKKIIRRFQVFNRNVANPGVAQSSRRKKH